VFEFALRLELNTWSLGVLAKAFPMALFYPPNAVELLMRLFALTQSTNPNRTDPQTKPHQTEPTTTMAMAMTMTAASTSTQS